MHRLLFPQQNILEFFRTGHPTVKNWNSLMSGSGNKSDHHFLHALALEEAMTLPLKPIIEDVQNFRYSLYASSTEFLPYLRTCTFGVWSKCGRTASKQN